MAETITNNLPTFRRLQDMQRSALVMAETAKAEYMDYLYQRSGRTSGHYTGLWQEEKDKVAEAFVQQLVEQQRYQWTLDRGKNNAA